MSKKEISLETNRISVFSELLSGRLLRTGTIQMILNTVATTSHPRSDHSDWAASASARASSVTDTCCVKRARVGVGDLGRRRGADVASGTYLDGSRPRNEAIRTNKSQASHKLLISHPGTLLMEREEIVRGRRRRWWPFSEMDSHCSLFQFSHNFFPILHLS